MRVTSGRGGFASEHSEGFPEFFFSFPEKHSAIQTDISHQKIDSQRQLTWLTVTMSWVVQKAKKIDKDFVVDIDESFISYYNSIHRYFVWYLKLRFRLIN